jgi:hypothetical protein
MLYDTKYGEFNTYIYNLVSSQLPNESVEQVLRALNLCADWTGLASNGLMNLARTFLADCRAKGIAAPTAVEILRESLINVTCRESYAYEEWLKAKPKK